MSLWWDAVRLRCCRDRPQLARLRPPSQGDQHDDRNQPDGDRHADPDEKPAHRALRLLPAANEPPDRSPQPILIPVPDPVWVAP